MKNKHAAALGKLGGSKNTPAQNAARKANSKKPRPNRKKK